MNELTKFKEAFSDKKVIITMPDDSVFTIPLFKVAYMKAKSLQERRGGTIIERLDGLVALFEDDFEVEDYLINNTNWEDLESIRKFVSGEQDVDYSEEWLSGELNLKVE